MLTSMTGASNIQAAFTLKRFYLKTPTMNPETKVETLKTDT